MFREALVFDKAHIEGWDMKKNKNDGYMFVCQLVRAAVLIYSTCLVLVLVLLLVFDNFCFASFFFLPLLYCIALLFIRVQVYPKEKKKF